MKSEQVHPGLGILLVVALLSVGMILTEREFGSMDARMERPKPGEELLLIFIGSPTCSAATDPEFPEIFAAIRSDFEAKAIYASLTPVTIGVGTGAGVEDSLDMLNRIGQWDEVMLGRGWLNGGALRYIWDTYAGPASVPQVLVLRRSLGTGGIGESIVREGEKVLVRKVGLHEIKSWRSVGSPIPGFRMGEGSL